MSKKLKNLLKILDNKKEVKQTSFYGVDKVTTLEPFDKKIVAKLGDKYNIYHKVMLVMKHSTQVYYNIRMILGLKIN